MTKNIFVALEVYLTPLFGEIFCFRDFFGTGTGTGTGQTDTHTYGQADFSRKILFQIYSKSVILDAFLGNIFALHYSRLQ